MKRAAAIGALVASLIAGSAAIAGPSFANHSDRESPRASNNDHRDFRGDRGDFHKDRSDSRRDDRYDNRQHDRYVRPVPPRVVYRAPARHYGVYHRPPGYYAHSWRRGERLPVAYYARPYVIDDYRDCGLRAPPRGYHWVRVNGDAVLAAVATGVVLDAVFNLF